MTRPAASRVLEVIAPAGFEGCFWRLGEIYGAGGPPDPDALAANGVAYDLDLDRSSIPRLVEAHGLHIGPR